jgi:hypothetical protein
MEIKKVVKWLLDNNYAVLVDGEIILTRKLADELSGIQVSEGKPKIGRIVVNTDEKKELWNKFILDCEVPHRVTSPDGKIYTIRQYNKQAVDKLISILKDPTINYQRFVESTKNYYKTVTYKNTLSNYLIREIWRGEYDYLPEHTTQGDNRFEE